MKILPQTRKGWFRALIPILLLAALLVFFVFIPFVRYSQYEPQEGDILFQPLPRVELVRAIEGMTGSPYSHCGVVVREDGKWLVIESIGQVRKTSLFRWVLRGRRGRSAAYRLKEPYQRHISQFINELYPFLGRPYDWGYRMDDEYLYCSELIYKAYRNATGEELGVLVKLGDMDWKPFEGTIRKYEHGPPPLDREMITPRHLSEAEQLEKVYGGDF